MSKINKNKKYDKFKNIVDILICDNKIINNKHNSIIDMELSIHSNFKKLNMTICVIDNGVIFINTNKQGNEYKILENILIKDKRVIVINGKLLKKDGR